MTESLSIFNGMEYTPIIVNLCKAVEELETDLIAKLNDKYDFNATDFRIGKRYAKDGSVKDYGQVFDTEQEWREEQTIGTLQSFINALNTAYSKTREKYDKAVGNSLTIYYLNMVAGTHIFSSEIKIKKGSASELLACYMDYWRIEIRNSHLHKDNILDADIVAKMYNDTLYLIGLLVDWYLIVSEEETA